jgi:DNA-binding LacI/PurR family transcriptional regulator
MPGRGARLAEIKQSRGLKRFLFRFSGDISSKATEGMGILTGVCACAAENNAEVVMSFSSPAEFLDELTARYAKGDIQGVLFLEHWSRGTMFNALETAGIPYLVANLEQDDDVLCCRMDFRDIGRQAGRYLLGKGHRHIGVMTGTLENFLYKEMLAGFRGALAEDEIYLKKEFIISPDADGGYSKLKPALMACERPTAFFAMRDNRAMKLYGACRDLGVRIPEDISVISYDNTTWPDGEHFGLTTLGQPVEQIGHKSVEMLKRWIVSGKKPESVKLYANLIERTSVKKL